MLGINRKQSDYDGRRIGAQEAARQTELIERAGGIVAYLTGPTFHKEAATATKEKNTKGT